MKELIQEKNHFKHLSYVINLTLLFYLFRIAIPFFKIPFIVLYFALITYSVIVFRKQLIPAFKIYVRDYYLLLVLAFFLVISFFASNKLYLTIIKDVINAAILLSLFFLMTLIVVSKSDLKTFINYLIRLILLFALVISVNGLCNLFNVFENGKVLFSTGTRSYLYNNTIEVDSNFAILPVIFSMIFIFYHLFKTESSRFRGAFNLLLIVYSFCIFFSGSRRGLIVLIVFILVSFLAQPARLIWKKSIFLRVGSITFAYVLSVIFLGISLWFFTSYTSYSFKNRTLEVIGTKNLLDTKIKIAEIMHKYSTSINKSIPFQDVYDLIWTPVFNPNDPESSWGNRIHKSVFPLSGTNVEIVPKDAIGYLMDSTCNPSYYREIDICESYSLMVNLQTSKGDHYNASVYCFVSDDFDGRAVTFGIASKLIVEKVVTGNVYAYYDLSKKGIWKKLELSFDCEGGKVPIFMFFNKSGIQDFSTLKGYVIFAHPQYEKANKADSSYSYSQNGNVKINDKKSGMAVPKMLISEKRASLLGFSAHLPALIYENNPDNDPIRRWIARFTSEDTTYYGYKNELLVDNKWDKYGDNRIARWVFALQIFSKEFNWKQKIFGGGFNFLNWYGYYFEKNKTTSDWPHNPFLSILLYSGILGLSIYCFFLFKVFYYYIKYIKKFPLLFIFFLITFYFSFFSGGSPFDPPIFGFFSIIPFFVHSVLKKDNAELNAID